VQPEKKFQGGGVGVLKVFFVPLLMFLYLFLILTLRECLKPSSLDLNLVLLICEQKPLQNHIHHGFLKNRVFSKPRFCGFQKVKNRGFCSFLRFFQIFL